MIIIIISSSLGFFLRLGLRVFCVANLQKLLSRQAGGNRPGLHVKICLQLVGRRLQTVLQISLVTDEVERKVPVDTFLPKGLRNLQVGENGLEAENDVVVPGTEARRGISANIGAEAPPQNCRANL